MMVQLNLINVYRKPTHSKKYPGFRSNNAVTQEKGYVNTIHTFKKICEDENQREEDDEIRK